MKYLLCFLALLLCTSIAMAEPSPQFRKETYKLGWGNIDEGGFWEELWHRICYGRGRTKDRWIRLDCPTPTPTPEPCPEPNPIPDPLPDPYPNPGSSNDIGPGTAPAPEPGTLLALGAGAAGAWIARRRKKNRFKGE